MSQKKPLNELTLLDRFLFAETMENPENLKIVLDIILDDDILLKGLPQAEKELRKSSLYRYAKVDIWAMDEQDTIYDAEVQGKNTGNLLKRTRYYQAMLDSQLLKPGDTDFNKLNRSFIVLIAPFDLFGYGLYRYTFVGQCLEIPGLKLDDDATRIFLNTHGTNSEGVSPELIELLHYMEHTNDKHLSFGNDRLFKLQENVKSVQENGEIGVKYMQLWEEYIEKFNEGVISTSIDFILELLEPMGEISDTLKEKITTQTDLSVLKDWHIKAARAASIEAFEKSII